jgi:DNA-binding transcriptional MerR regulator
MSPTDYSIADVAAVTETPIRTIRYYIAQGLLPSAGKTGPAARYDGAFVARLRAIRRLQEAHLPLAVIQATLEGLDEAGVREIVERPEQVPADSASDYVKRLLSGESAPGVREQSVDYPDTLFMAAPGMPAAWPDLSEPTVEPAPPDRSHWERIVLAPGVELHVRRPNARASTKRVERLVEFAQQLFRKGAP